MSNLTVLPVPSKVPAEFVRGDAYQGDLQVGQRVYSGLYGRGCGVIIAIHGRQDPGGIERMMGGCIVRGGRAEIDVAFESGISRQIPESIIRGVQWDISTEVVHPDEIHHLVWDAQTAMDRKAEEKRKAEEEFQQEIEAMPARYPRLTPLNASSRRDVAVGAANLRKELKETFPGTTFSVKSSSYSGGCSIDVAYQDGPAYEAVNDLANKYQTSDFDGMQDLKVYRKNPFSRVFGGADYVNVSRKVTPRALVQAGAQFGYQFLEEDVLDFGRILGLDDGAVDDVRRAARKMDFRSLEAQS